MTNFIKDFIRDDSGAAAAEYVLLLAVLGGGIAVGALAFGTSIKNALTTKGTYLETCAKSTNGTGC